MTDGTRQRRKSGRGSQMLPAEIQAVQCDFASGQFTKQALALKYGRTREAINHALAQLEYLGGFEGQRDCGLLWRLGQAVAKEAGHFLSYQYDVAYEFGAPGVILYRLLVSCVRCELTGDSSVSECRGPVFEQVCQSSRVVTDVLVVNAERHKEAQCLKQAKKTAAAIRQLLHARL